jgi:hypothetical protein
MAGFRAKRTTLTGPQHQDADASSAQVTPVAETPHLSSRQGSRLLSLGIVSALLGPIIPAASSLAADSGRPDNAPNRANATVFRCLGGGLFDRLGQRLSPTGQLLPALADLAELATPPAGTGVSVTVGPWSPVDYPDCSPTAIEEVGVSTLDRSIPLAALPGFSE